MFNHKIEISQDLCITCGKCINLCPMGAILIIDNTVQIDSKLCRGCRICLRGCPTKAIKYV